MSYIVPGDIPKNCFACPCGYETEGAFIDECLVLKREYEKDADSVRPNWCPLVEIKTPHGRLIDADELKTAFPTCDNSKDIKVASVRATINHMQTIIEAERSEE